MYSLEKTIKQLNDQLKGKINTPIIVGGWAINLLGKPRQTIDLDMMILESDFDKFTTAFKNLNYVQSIKTALYARFESKEKSNFSGLPYIDCLFADKNTYQKIVAAGKKTVIFGADFILPNPMHIIAMKLHALKYTTTDRGKDLDDIFSLIELYNIDVSKDSDFEKVCKKYGTNEILRKIRNEEK